MDEKKEGWTWLSNSKKWHYFHDGRSLCRRWAHLGSDDVLKQGNDDSSDNCVVCCKKLKKEYEKQNKADPLPW